MQRILFLIAHPKQDAGCRYRVYQFLPYFERAGYECTVAPFSTERLFYILRTGGNIMAKILETVWCAIRRAIVISRVPHFDFVVIHREVFPFLTPLWEKIVLRRSRKAIFSFDDAVYTGHPDVSSLTHPWLYRLKYGRGVNDVLRGCHHIVAGNRILGDYARSLNPHVTVIPTVVDCDYYEYQQPQGDRDRPVTVGWMGSPSTGPYLSIVEPALRLLAQTFPGRIQFRFFGFPQYKLDVPAFASLPFRLSSEIADLHSMDIGIMPLPDTVWTSGKCAFKAIQYMATGAVAVASPIGVTTDLIRHQENGLLARSTEEWFEALSRLVTDLDLRQALSRHARRTILDGYSLQQWGPRFVGVLDELAGAELSLAGTGEIFPV